MINPTTLILATLVFNAASVFGAPLRFASSPEVAVREAVVAPVLPRAVVVDTTASLARETEYDSRDAASSLPEVDTIVRRYPRGILHDFYERAPEPTPAPSGTDTPADNTRRFPRRVYHDFYTKRSETAQEEVRAEPEPELVRSFPRQALAERYAARAPSTEEMVSREPQPAPAVEEPVRRFARRALADEFEKRQADPAAPSPVSSTATTVIAPGATATLSGTTTGAPVTLDQAIAGAVAQSITNNGNNGNTNTKTHIEITIEHSGSSDSKVVPPQAAPSSTASSAAASPTATQAATGAQKDAGAAAAAPSPAATETPVDGATTPSEDAASRRDVGEDQPQPIARRSGGISGALWATWNRRNL